MESQKSAETLTTALQAFNKELDKQEFLQELGQQDAASVAALDEAANELQRHHQSWIDQLQELTANVGLLQVDLPLNFDEKDTDFIKTLILLHAIKVMLWNRLQQVHDELNLICDSASCSRSLGVLPVVVIPCPPCITIQTNHILIFYFILDTKKLQTALKAVQGRAGNILSTINDYNIQIGKLHAKPCPVWMQRDQLPQKIPPKAAMRIDPDAPFWSEMELGNVWVELWGEDRFAAAPGYVRDPNVWGGIRAVLLLDLIAEEQERLVLEEQNECSEVIWQIEGVSCALKIVAAAGKFLVLSCN